MMEQILDYVNVAIVFAAVIVIQSIKNIIEERRKKKALKPLDKTIWKIVVLCAGIPMAAIVLLIGSEPFNIFSFIFYVFLYSASSSFVYQNYKLVKDGIKKALGVGNKKGKKYEF